MGDRLWAGKLSWYVTCHPGQLSLAIPLWVGVMSTSLGWEGTRRSRVASVIRVRFARVGGLSPHWLGTTPSLTTENIGLGVLTLITYVFPAQ